LGEGLFKYVTLLLLDFIHIVDKKMWQDKLISTRQGGNQNAYLATRDYDRIDTIYASLQPKSVGLGTSSVGRDDSGSGQTHRDECLACVGPEDEKQYQNYHRVLNRAKW